MQRAARLLARFGRDQSGIAAIEFAALAPVLVFMVLGALDLTGALTERMAIGHVLRAGAQVAMTDPGPTAVQGTMTTVARDFTLGTTPGPRTLVLTSQKRCACPGVPETEVACTTICTGSQPTTISYRLRAEKRYNANLLPDMRFVSELEVQIR